MFFSVGIKRQLKSHVFVVRESRISTGTCAFSLIIILNLPESLHRSTLDCVDYRINSVSS